MIKFICVTDREVENGYCTLCTSKVTSPYLRQRATRLLYCGTKCYWEHYNVGLLAIEDYGRRASCPSRSVRGSLHAPACAPGHDVSLVQKAGAFVDVWVYR